MTKRFGLRFFTMLYLADLVLTALALRLSGVLRLWLPWGSGISAEDVIIPPAIYVMAALIWTVVFQVFSVYDPQRTPRLGDDLQHLIPATFTSTLVLAGALYLSFRDFSRLQFFYFLALNLAFLGGLRFLLRLAFHLQGGRRFDTRRVLVVGAGPVGYEAAAMIQRYAWAGLEMVGYLDDDPHKRVDNPEVLGVLEDAPRLVQEQEIDEVVVALPLRAHGRLAAVIHALQQVPVNVRVVPDYFNLVFLRAGVEDFGGMPLITIREPALTDFERLVKRAFDLVAGTVLTIAALPLMALVALAIKLDSPGPVLFPQQRVGEDGKIFHMYKFRSMVEDAEQRRDEVIAYDADGTLHHKRPDDPRVTRVGRFLRAYSLDELPQFFNVLKGDMSLVGPRPEMPWLVEEYEEWQRKRFAVPQGVTGWWQVNGRSDKPMHLHTEDDLYYIRNYSLGLDLRILWKTLWVVLVRRGAY